MDPSRVAPRGVYEQPYRLNGMVVLVAVDSAGDYAGHVLVADEPQYLLARERPWGILHTRDPSPPLRVLGSLAVALVGIV